MNFGNAIEILKAGGCVTRHGWNGKHMYLFLKNGSYPSKTQPTSISGVSTHLFDLGDKGTGVRMPTVCMKTADDTIVEGWLASQTDMLSDDWAEVRFVENVEEEEAVTPKHEPEVRTQPARQVHHVEIQADTLEELIEALVETLGEEAADQVLAQMEARGFLDQFDDEDEQEDDEDDDLLPCNCRICKGHWLN